MKAFAFIRQPMAVVAVILGCLLITPATLAQKAEPKKPKVDARRAAAMVEGIANRNKAPKYVKWPGSWTENAALFPENHDWKEEARVWKAVYQLKQDQTEEVWEELVKHINDRRYCTTSTEIDTGDAYIQDVGSICGGLADSRLIGVYWQHLPPDPNSIKGHVLSLDVGVNGLSRWRKQRAAKTLYELQIEVCEKAIESLASAKGVRQAQKDHVRKQIEAEIAKLRKTRQPVHVQGGYDYYCGRKYNAELARRVREGVKTGKYPDLGIVK
jgi:hypothetical protein